MERGELLINIERRVVPIYTQNCLLNLIMTMIWLCCSSIVALLWFIIICIIDNVNIDVLSAANGINNGCYVGNAASSVKYYKTSHNVLSSMGWKGTRLHQEDCNQL